MRKIEVLTDTPTEFELGDAAADIQWAREGRGQREVEEESQKQREEKQREEVVREETIYSAEEGVAKKCARTGRSDTEVDTEAGGEVGILQLLSRHKNGHVMNIYLTDSDEEAIVDFISDHKELYNKTNDLFKDKARKQCL